MIRWESVTVSVLGAGLGLVIGILFGTAVVMALADVGIATLRIPLGSMVGFVVLAALAGMAAAILPARRAGRLDVLAAISHE